MYRCKQGVTGFSDTASHLFCVALLVMVALRMQIVVLYLDDLFGFLL